jgi:nicotinamidase/pyrazinamidase
MSTVFVDVDTQIDFVYPAGALAVTGAARLLPNVAALNEFAGKRGIPVVSTTDAHLENDPEFAHWPPHCVAGTIGQQKPAATLLTPRVVVPVEPAVVETAGVRQFLIEKRALDCFTNPNLPGLLDNLGATRCVVYGFATEYCVRCAVLGLLATGRRVELVTDAAKGISAADAARARDEFTAAGGVLTSTAQALAG